jgi:hypothetical protein
MMRRVEELTMSKVVDCPAASAWVTADMTTRLQASPKSINAETLREQCWQACEALRENRAPVVPYSFIERFLGIDEGTVKYYSKGSEALSAALGRNGRSSILRVEHREDLVRQIEEACHHGIP